MSASKPRRRAVRKTNPAPGALPPAPSSRLAVFAAALLISVAALAAYSNSFAGVFVFDDEPAIAQNPNLRTLWPLTTAVRAPADTTLSGRPVATLSFALDAARTGGSLWGYHATNLAIHVGAALLLFGITRRTLLTAPMRDRFSRAATTLALIVALVFAVHPVQTASVTYIVQRVESLMGLFYLATLYCAIRALNATATARRWWTATSAIACALGMGTKEVMVTAPLMVMLWDRQFASDRTRQRRWLYGLLASTWIVLAILVAGGHRSLAVGFGFTEWPWWRYLATQAGVVAHYLRLAVLPAPMVLDYDWRPAMSLSAVIVPGVLICALVAVSAWGLLRRVPAAFAGGWWFLILAPSSSVIPIVTEVAAEHRMYLPLAGVAALVVLGAYEAGLRLTARGLLSRRAAVHAGLGAAALVAALFAVMTYQRNADYQSYDRIWLDTIVKQPRNARARNNYATSLLAARRFAEAEPHLRVAVRENPSFAEAEANLGVALAAQGRLDEGTEHLKRAIALQPDYASAHRNLGEAYATGHRLAEAAAAFTKAVEYRPADVTLLNRAAWILATAPDQAVRNGARAVAFAERAVSLTHRQDADSLDTLAAALAERGDFDGAAAHAREALQVARLKGDRELFGSVEARLALYRAGRPFRER